MKKTALAMLALLAIAGCGDLTWFPDTKASTSTGGGSSSNANNSNNGTGDSSVNTGSTPDPSVTATTFAAKCGSAAGSTVVSNAIKVTGLSGMASITVSGGDNSAYSINDGTFTNAPGIVLNGWTVKVEHTAAVSGAPSPQVATTLKINNTTYTFTSSTNACSN